MRLRTSAFALSTAAIIAAEENEQAKQEALAAYEQDLRALNPDDGEKIDALFDAISGGTEEEVEAAVAALGATGTAEILVKFAVAVGERDDVLDNAINLDGLTPEKAAERERAGNLWNNLKGDMPKTHAFSEKLLDAEDTLARACAAGEDATGLNLGFAAPEEEKKAEAEKDNSLSSGFSLKLPKFSFGSS